MKYVLAAAALMTIGAARADSIDDAFKICAPHMLIEPNSRVLLSVAKDWQEECKPVYQAWVDRENAKSNRDAADKAKIKQLMAPK